MVIKDYNKSGNITFVSVSKSAEWPHELFKCGILYLSTYIEVSGTRIQ